MVQRLKKRKKKKKEEARCHGKSSNYWAVVKYYIVWTFAIHYMNNLILMIKHNELGVG